MARRRNTRSIFHHGSTPDRRVVDSPEVAPVPSRTASLPQVDLEPTRQLPVFQAAQLEPVDRLSILARQETDLLRAMATAPYSEQTAMMAKLTSIRAERTAHIAAARDLDLANAIIGDHLTPVVSAGIRSTAKSDWLAQVPSVAMGSLDHEMVVEASLFYSGLHTAVKADAEELVIQSLGRARAVAGRFDADAPAAVRVFMDEIVRLAEAHPAGEPADDGVAHSTLPVIEDPTDAPETFDEDTFDRYEPIAGMDYPTRAESEAAARTSSSVLKAINDTMWSHLAAAETEDDDDYDASEHDWQSKNDDTKDDTDTGGDQEPEDDEDDDSPFPKKESVRRTAGWVGERVFLEGVTPATVLTEPDDDGRVQVQTADDKTLWAHPDSFTTNGAPRQREASRRTAVSTEELRAAHQFLGQFKEGDSVIVSRDGREMTMYVKRPLELSDFAYEGDKLVPAGAWDSANIQVTFGPGRYTAEISVNAQAAKSGMPYIVGRADATTASRRTAAERNPNGQYSDWPGGDGACSKCFVGMPHTKAEHDESVIQGKSLGLDKHLDKAPQGTYSSRQSRRVASAVDDLRQIVDSKTMGTVNGQTVDLFSASAVLSVLDALGPENQAQFTQIIESNPAQAATVAFKLLNSQGKAASTKTGAVGGECIFCGKPVDTSDPAYAPEWGDIQGHQACYDDPEAVADFDRRIREWPPRASSRRTAADGATCSVCGDAIAKDPDGTYHHDNGEKHDHEAQAGGSKESRRKTAADEPAEDGAAKSTLPVAIDPTDAPEGLDQLTDTPQPGTGMVGEGSTPAPSGAAAGGPTTFNDFVADHTKAAAFRQRVQANLRNR